MNRRRFLKQSIKRYGQAIAGSILLEEILGCRPTSQPVAPNPSALRTNFPVNSVVDPAQANAAPQLTRHPVRFTDITRQAGIQWTHSNGATGKHLFVETSGGGVALFDYNNDGLLDIFALQSGPLPHASTPEEKNFPARNVLYRNNGDGTFTDVTAGSGLDGYTGYGQGVAVADFDNDGWPDLYITAYGGNRLFRNNRNGTFTDVTAKAGLADTVSGIFSELPWPLSAAWADYDNDGHLDLFVCHYVRWSPTTDHQCFGAGQRLLYCRPQVYEPSHCRLYHNNGDGTFSDVTVKAGLDRLEGKSMGVAWVDYDDDGWMDIFVTNDTMPNFLLHNNRDGTFTESGVLAGVAVGEIGKPESGMGIGVGDYDNDGREDIFAVNFAGEPKSVYHNNGDGSFTNAASSANFSSMNLQFLGFGLECFDYDLDGYKDLIVGNGHVLDRTEAESNGSTYEQSQQLIHNSGDGKFTDDQRSLGDLVKPRVTRGLAVGDIDNDGDIDVVLMGQNEPLQLFRNDGGNQHNWITFRLEGDPARRSNRDGIGAKVVIQFEGTGAEAKTGSQTQWVRGGSSYCSQSDRRITFGLGERTEIVGLSVRWPNGQRQKFGKLPANRFYYLREGHQPVLDPRIKRK